MYFQPIDKFSKTHLSELYLSFRLQSFGSQASFTTLRIRIFRESHMRRWKIHRTLRIAHSGKAYKDIIKCKTSAYNENSKYPIQPTILTSIRIFGKTKIGIWRIVAFFWNGGIFFVVCFCRVLFLLFTARYRNPLEYLHGGLSYCDPFFLPRKYNIQFKL